MTSEGFTVLAMISALVIVTVFAGLIWAAVQDGRDERASRRKRRSAGQRRG